MTDASRNLQLERKIEEARDISARGFQAVTRDLAELQREVSQLRAQIQGLLSWVGHNAMSGRGSVALGGEPRLIPEFEVRPGSFMSGATILRKEFDCDISLKNVGSGLADDFQLDVAFPADYAEVGRSPQFFLRKTGEYALFRVRESNYPNERLLPDRDVRVLTIHFAITPELFYRLSTEKPEVRVQIKTSSQDDQTRFSLVDLVVLSSDEQRSFNQWFARLPQEKGA